MPPRTRMLSEADRTLWANYANMILPMSNRALVRAPADANLPPAAALSSIRTAPPPIVRSPRSDGPPLSVGTQPGGLDTATWQRFRSNKLSVARTLDLHGLSVQRAFHALVTFLRSAHADRLRCVEIVTGRGNGENGGAIRRELPYWLNLPDIRPMVLGAAHPHTLNPGSVRLLLRRIR